MGSDYQQFGLGDEGEVLREILQESKILEMKLYRDRVRPVNLTQPYKKFLNGKIYEEPSRLIGRIYDVNGYKTSGASYKAGQTFIKETNLSPRAESYVNRYFVFSDYEVGSYDAGLYRYRVVTRCYLIVIAGIIVSPLQFYIHVYLIAVICFQ